MLGTVFDRFVEKSPISVMVRATLERVLGADRLDLWYERTAEKQHTRELLFSTVYDLMSQVVFCVQPSGRAAYLAHDADVGTSIVSVYNKLNGCILPVSPLAIPNLIRRWREIGIAHKLQR